MIGGSVSRAAPSLRRVTMSYAATSSPERAPRCRRTPSRSLTLESAAGSLHAVGGASIFLEEHHPQLLTHSLTLLIGQTVDDHAAITFAGIAGRRRKVGGRNRHVVEQLGVARRQ